MAHTQGPWTIQDEYEGCLPIDAWDSIAEESTEIARVSMDSISDGEQFANALLIAAAPDLLTALNAAHRLLMLTDWRNDDEAMRGIEAALAKARGE